MRSFNFLNKLTGFEPRGFPFLSIYLNTEPNGTGKKDFDIFLNKQLNDHEAVMEVNSPRRESFAKDAARIRYFVENDLDPATRGLALFACSGAGDFFEDFQFEVPFEENEFFLYEKPHIYPLVRLMEQHPSFAIVAADTNAAHIYVIRRGETLRQVDLQNTKTNRTEVGGWSQKRYQRHVGNFHRQHAKEVIDDLEKIMRGARIERVILAGDETGIIPILRDEMSKELNEKVAGVLPLHIETPEDKLIDEATQALRKHDAEADKERIEYLFEHNYDEGVGVTGVDKTLAALMNGQVQELYLTADISEITYRRGDVEQVLADYAPGDQPTEEADPNEPKLLIDELIKYAAQSSDKLRIIEDPHLLKTAGGVGAILRYQAKGVSL